MKFDFTTTNPGDIDMTMTITMPLRKWAELKDQLSSAHPAWELQSHIRQMVHAAEQHFKPEYVA